MKDLAAAVRILLQLFAFTQVTGYTPMGAHQRLSLSVFATPPNFSRPDACEKARRPPILRASNDDIESQFKQVLDQLGNATTDKGIVGKLETLDELVEEAGKKLLSSINMKSFPNIARGKSAEGESPTVDKA